MIKDYLVNNMIIKPWDERFIKLNLIWSKYLWNWDDDIDNLNWRIPIICRYDSGVLYYFVPPELVENEYITNGAKVYKNPGRLTDNNWNNWVFSNKLGHILDKTVGITLEEYYLLLGLQTNTHLDTPRCIYCGCKLPFYKLMHPYTQFCSKDCQACYQLEHPELYPGFGYAELNQDINYIVKCSCMTFINQGDAKDTCYLYHAITKSGRFKYGVTKNLSSRVIGSRGHDTYLSIKSDYTDTRLNIAYLEARIKLHFDGNEYLDISQKDEYFKVLKDLLDNPIINPYETN